MRDAVGPEIRLSLDANQAWSVDEAIAALGVLSAVGEADPQAAQRLEEILKREFGIGEAP